MTAICRRNMIEEIWQLSVGDGHIPQSNRLPLESGSCFTENLTSREWFLFLARRRENHMFLLGVFPWRFSPPWRLTEPPQLCSSYPALPTQPSLQPLLLSHSPIPQLYNWEIHLISYYLINKNMKKVFSDSEKYSYVTDLIWLLQPALP